LHGELVVEVSHAQDGRPEAVPRRDRVDTDLQAELAELRSAEKGRGWMRPAPADKARVGGAVVAASHAYLTTKGWILVDFALVARGELFEALLEDLKLRLHVRHLHLRELASQLLEALLAVIRAPHGANADASPHPCWHSTAASNRDLARCRLRHHRRPHRSPHASS
jgi:hypothetical protein